jgi:hypothetical protein
MLSGPRSRGAPHPAFFFFAGSSGGGGRESDGGGGGKSLGGGGALELGGGGGAKASGGGGGGDGKLPFISSGGEDIEESPLLKPAISINDGARVSGTFRYTRTRPHSITGEMVWLGDV